MGVSIDSTLDARVSTYVLNPSLYGIEFSNAQDFIADAPLVDCNGLTAGAGIIANRGSSGSIANAVVKSPAAGAPCISLNSSSDIAIVNPRLSSKNQVSYIAVNDSSRCSTVGGTIRDDQGSGTAMLVYSQYADASDNSFVGVTVHVTAPGSMTVLKVLAFTNGKHADRNMVSGLTVVGNAAPASKGAFLQSANGGRRLRHAPGSVEPLGRGREAAVAGCDRHDRRKHLVLT